MQETISARTVDMAVQLARPEEKSRLWEQVLLAVRARLGSHQAFDTWFKPIVARELDPQRVDLEVPNAFFVDWIHEHHLSTLRLALQEVLGASPEVRFSPRELVLPSSSPAPVAARVAAAVAGGAAGQAGAGACGSRAS
jgi:chromosomal replication initiation ATPase DnaA